MATAPTIIRDGLRMPILPESSKPPLPPFSMADFAKADAERKRAEEEAIRNGLRKGSLPTAEPIVRALVWRVDRPSLMRDHVYWQEHKIRAGFEALVSAALSAHLDLTRAEAALTAYAISADGFGDHVQHTVENPAQKEVMAFCSAYVGTIDTLRRFTKRRADIWDAIEAIRTSTTGDIEFRFIFELRKNLSHGSVVVPYWSVMRDGAGTSGKVHFSVSELLAFGSWGADVKSFLQSKGDKSFSISEITAHCSTGLAKFRRELNILFERHKTDAERDFHAINDFARRIGSRQMNLLILKAVADKGVDPYPHLHRYFSAEETRRILEYPPHSAEQVGYIVRLREASVDINAEALALLYRLFGVSEQIEVPKEMPTVAPKPLGDAWPPRSLTAKTEHEDSA